MRRTLVIGSICALIVAGIGLALLLLMAGSAGSAGWVVVFVLTLLALIGAVIAGVFGIVLPRFGRSSDPEAISAAAAAGREGLARVLSATPTGAQVNGAYVYDADLVVDQTRAPAYRRRERIRVHRDDGTLSGGEIVSVVRVRDDAPEVVVVAGPARTPQDVLVPEDAPPWL